MLLRSTRAFADTAAKDETASASTAKGEQSPQIEVMDIPTADILDPMTYSTSFRFYNEGGLMSRLVIGPLKRVNLGISFDAQRIIGSSDPHLIRPSVYFKLRFFDGTDLIPALALGYDNQGYLYQEPAKQFLNREKGLYIVGSHEILVPNLEVHAGVNIFDFDNNAAVFGFFGATFKITPNFSLLADYDNIRSLPLNRFNMGGRYWIAPYFNIDFGARNIGRGTADGAERILRLNYVGHFPL